MTSWNHFCLLCLAAWIISHVRTLTNALEKLYLKVFFVPIYIYHHFFCFCHVPQICIKIVSQFTQVSVSGTWSLWKVDVSKQGRRLQIETDFESSRRQLRKITELKICVFARTSCNPPRLNIGWWRRWKPLGLSWISSVLAPHQFIPLEQNWIKQTRDIDCERCSWHYRRPDSSYRWDVSKQLERTLGIKEQWNDVTSCIFLPLQACTECEANKRLGDGNNVRFYTPGFKQQDY